MQVTALSGPRVSPKEDVLLSNGLVVPRGTVIWPMVYTVQMHPDNWHEADRSTYPPTTPGTFLQHCA